MIESAGREFTTFIFSWRVHCWLDGDALPKHCALMSCVLIINIEVVNVIRRCALIILPLWGLPRTLRHHTSGRNKYGIHLRRNFY